MADFVFELAEIIFDLSLGLLGLSIYFLMDIAIKKKRSKKYQLIFEEAGQGFPGMFSVCKYYFNQGPFVSVAVLIWVIVSAVLGDVELVAEVLPGEESRHTLMFFNGILAHVGLDKIVGVIKG